MDERAGIAELKVWSAALQPLWRTETSFGGGMPNPQSFAFSAGATIAINRIEAVAAPDPQTRPIGNQWVQLLAAADGAELLRFPGAGAVTLALSPDGTLLAGGCQCSGGLSGARLWRNDGTAGPRLGEKGDQAFAVAFSPDGALLAVRAAYPTDAGRPRTTVWRVADRSLLWGQDAVAEPNSRLAYVTFSPDGARLASISVTVPVVKVYRTSDGLLEAEIPVEQPLMAAFAPGAPDVIAIAERRGHLTLRRLHDADPIATISGTFTALSFSPDDHVLLAGDTTGVVHQFCSR
jgi:WD40 repeat protein